MRKLKIDWTAVPDWAQWAAQDDDGEVFVFDARPSLESWGFATKGDHVQFVRREQANIYWRGTLTKRPRDAGIDRADSDPLDGVAMLRAQIGHLLEDLSTERLDALYAHVRGRVDAAKLAELNAQLMGRTFGEVPREWQLKAFEAYLDGYVVAFRDTHIADRWHITRHPDWAIDARFRIFAKQG